VAISATVYNQGHAQFLHLGRAVLPLLLMPHRLQSCPGQEWPSDPLGRTLAVPAGHGPGARLLRRQYWLLHSVCSDQASRSNSHVPLDVPLVCASQARAADGCAGGAKSQYGGFEFRPALANYTPAPCARWFRQAHARSVGRGDQ
jgi:hypothetical protein